MNVVESRITGRHQHIEHTRVLIFELEVVMALGADRNRRRDLARNWGLRRLDRKNRQQDEDDCPNHIVAQTRRPYFTRVKIRRHLIVSPSPPSAKGLCSTEKYIARAFPVMRSRGTVPQNRLSSLLSRLSPSRK